MYSFNVKHGYLLVFILCLFSCSDNSEDPVIKNPTGPATDTTSITHTTGDCILIKWTASDSVGVYLESEYGYNTNGQIVTQTRTRKGVEFLRYTYTYNSQGRVLAVISKYNDITTENTYDSIGRLSKVINRDNKTDNISETWLYHWSTNTLNIHYQRLNSTLYDHTEDYEFFNENITRVVEKEYVDYNTKKLRGTSDTQYLDFDSGLDPFYIASLSRPGYSSPQSRNNPRKETRTTTFYAEGVATLTKTRITNYSYIYNKSGALISQTDDDDVDVGKTLLYIYSNCD